MQQANAEVPLQPLQALAGNRYGQIHAAGGGADRTKIQYAKKQADIADAIHDYQAFIETDY